MSSRPVVSVLMPVFNSEQYLPEALTSILDQSFNRLELLAIDDGSTDGSLEILSTFAARDQRLKFLSRENRGAVPSRNELMNMAAGELIAWMDSDDISEKDRLSIQVDQFRSNSDLACIGGACLLVDPEGLPIHIETFPEKDGDIRQEQWNGGGIRFGTSMMRTNLARQAGLFREPFTIGEDLDFLMRLGEFGQLANLPNVLLRYRRHPESQTALLEADWDKHRTAILDLARERISGKPDRLDNSGAVELTHTPESSALTPTELHINWARLAIANGYQETARKHATIGLKAAPLKPIAWKTWFRALLCRTSNH